MGQFVDYRKKYQEGKDLIAERIRVELPEGASEEQKAKRLQELKLLKVALNARAGEALGKFIALLLFVGGIFYHPLLLASAGCIALALFNFMRLEAMKSAIRRLINEDTN